MNKKRRKNRSRGIILKSIIIAICVVAIGIYYMFFTGMSRSGEETYLYIDSDDNVDSVYQKLSPISTKHSLWAFKQLARYKSYGDHIKTGRYQIGSHGALQTFRYVRNGIQAPVNVTINSVRTTERLAARARWSRLAAMRPTAETAETAGMHINSKRKMRNSGLSSDWRKRRMQTSPLLKLSRWQVL